MKNFEITEDAVVSHAICQRKSYLILYQHDKGKEQPYASLLREKMQEAEAQFFRKKAKCIPYSSENLTGDA